MTHMKTCHEIPWVSPPAPAPALADHAQALEKAERLKSPAAIRGRVLKLKCAGNTQEPCSRSPSCNTEQPGITEAQKEYKVTEA